MRKRTEPLQIVEHLSDIPLFQNESEEDSFWGTHRLSEALLDQMQPLGPEDAPPTRATSSVTLRIDPVLLERLQALAQQRQMPYQRLLKQLLVERLQQVEASGQQTAPPTLGPDPEIVRKTARSIALLARDLEAAVTAQT